MYKYEPDWQFEEHPGGGRGERGKYKMNTKEEARNVGKEVCVDDTTHTQATLLTLLVYSTCSSHTSLSPAQDKASQTANHTGRLCVCVGGRNLPT